jgi:transcriptional regulator with XRE-family HTH domain
MKLWRDSVATANMIQELLKEKGWSKAELARQLGVSTQTVVYWTKGTTVPRGKRLAQLSEISGYSQSWFLGRATRVLPFIRSKRRHG